MACTQMLPSTARAVLNVLLPLVLDLLLDLPYNQYLSRGLLGNLGCPPKSVVRFVNETVFEEGGDQQHNREETCCPHDDQQNEQVTNLQLDQDNAVMDQNEDDQKC